MGRRIIPAPKSQLNQRARPEFDLPNSKMECPIFVLGCQRSGTSLLRRLLDSHSGIACPPESSFVVQLARVFEIERSLTGLLNMGFSREDVLEQMRVFIATFFERYAASKGKKRWADKTPHYVNHAQTIDLIFKQKPRYVGIVRHGLDVAYSLVGFDWGILEPYLATGVEKPVAAMRLWRDQNKKILDFQQKVGPRLHFIKYEDLTAKPAETMRGVFEFLNETWDRRVLDYVNFEHDEGHGDPKIHEYAAISENSYNYREWPLEMQTRLYDEAKDVLEHFNYRL